MRRHIWLFFACLAPILSLPNALFSEVIHDDFFVVTPEKTGTHLLTKTLTKLLDKQCQNNWQHVISKNDLMNLLENAKENNMFVQMHALPTKVILDTLHELNYKILFLLRDPRDQIVSLYHYIEKGWAYGPLRLDMRYGQLPKNKKIDELITGRRYGLSATRSIIGRRLPWMKQDSSFALTLFFENLVGEKGGGTKESQTEEILSIASFINVELTEDEVLSRTQNIFGHSGEGTFRKGQIGAWRETFTSSHKSAMKSVFGAELIKIGYEDDFNW